MSMNYKTFRFAFSDLNLKVTAIEDVIGKKAGEDNEFVRRHIENALNELTSTCKIKGQYSLFQSIDFHNENSEILIEGLPFSIGKIVYNQLKGSGSVALFLCTAGEEIEVLIKKAMLEGDLLKGYVYDVIGSEIAESATDLLQNELLKEAEENGLKITNRYSPGYCEWSVAEQHKLFSLIPENFCGIKLTPSALMDPVKSVSGIIGIGENVRFNKYSCGICNMKDCVYRGRKFEK
jgi:hypothetical protein